MQVRILNTGFALLFIHLSCMSSFALMMCLAFTDDVSHLSCLYPHMYRWCPSPVLPILFCTDDVTRTVNSLFRVIYLAFEKGY